MGAEQARAQLPALIDAAARGTQTLITRHGKPCAALVPAKQAERRDGEALTSLQGSGKGMWGRDPKRLLRGLRVEWERE